MEKEKGDLKSLTQIKELVDLFYEKVRMDPLIGPIFEEKIKGNWDKHLEKMYQLFPKTKGKVIYKNIGSPLSNEYYLGRSAS